MPQVREVPWYNWPPPSGNTFVRVGVISTGLMPIRTEYLTELMCEGGPTGPVKIPSFAFLVEHPKERLLFDIGLPRFLANPMRTRLAPLVPVAKLFGILPEVKKGEDTGSQLRNAGLVPSSVNTVIYSHHHFDHTGNIRDYTSAEIVVGPGVTALKNDWRRIYKGLNPDDLPEDRPVREIDFGKTPGPKLGPFEKTHDLMGDGSVYLVDTPGHCTGAMGALLRLKSGWVFLAGDAVYIRDNYRKPAPKGVLMGRSADEDRPRAWTTILEIRELWNRVPEIRIWPSHEPELFTEAALFPDMHE